MDFALFAGATASSSGKALVEFLVSADGHNCGARLIYAAGPEEQSLDLYEPIESPDFKAWLMGRMNAFAKKVTGEEIFAHVGEAERGGS